MVKSVATPRPEPLFVDTPIEQRIGEPTLAGLLLVQRSVEAAEG